MTTNIERQKKERKKWFHLYMCEIVHRHGMATKCEAGGGCSCNFALLWNFTSSFSSQRLPTNPYNKAVSMNCHNYNGCSWAQKLIGWQHLFNSNSRWNDKEWRNTFCFFGAIIQKKDNVPIAAKQNNWCKRGNKQIHISVFSVFSKQYFLSIIQIKLYNEIELKKIPEILPGKAPLRFEYAE